MDKRNWKFTRFGLLLLFLHYHNLILCWSLNDEGLALLKFKERIASDPYDALKNWNNLDGVVNPCLWFGIECSDGKVVNLNLKDLCLGGALAPDLRNLVHIKSIVLRNNSFSGVIPEGLGELTELEVLDFGCNNLSGQLPPDLGSNLSLTIFLLDNNELLGNLSPEILQLKTLSEIQVGENELSTTAKESSCNKRSVTWNTVQTKNAINRRQLQSTSVPRESQYNHVHVLALSDVSVRLPPVEGSDFPPVVIPSPAEESNAPSPSPNDSSSDNLLAPTPSPNDSSSDNLLAPTPSPNSSSSSTPLAPHPLPLNSSSEKHVPIIVGATGGALLVISIISIYLCQFNKATVKPWRTGLSGQLQKAFVTGIPKLKRSELEAACEDFSNVLGSSPIGTMYKGTLSSGVEIAVAKVALTSSKDWPKNFEVQFRKKIETLSKINHKNFVNLLGYCEEEQPFTRMLVLEYAPNGTLFEHLHIKESEHLDWQMRLRIAMGIAYCLEHMHQLNPPKTHSNLNSSAISLSEDYAAKVSDFSFSNMVTATKMEATKKFLDTPTASRESNVYSFGVLLFEMVTGRLPYSVNDDSLEDWASDYLRVDQSLKNMVDPTLDSFEEEKLERVGEMIKSCVHPDPKQRPEMREVTAILREITGIARNGAIPKLNPLWWAELEILSLDAD